jgi:hypothetical protein
VSSGVVRMFAIKIVSYFKKYNFLLMHRYHILITCNEWKLWVLVGFGFRFNNIVTDNIQWN